MADSDEELEEQVEEVEEAEPEEEEDTSLANGEVVNKYQEAGRIVQTTLQELIALAVPGATLLSLCVAGDRSIETKAAAVYRGKNSKGKNYDRGIAFPVCVSVNEVVCHYSPLLSEDKLPPLAVGDLVKIDLGAQVDGYIAVAAHTFIVGRTEADGPITGNRANVLAAAWTAAEVAAKLIRPGATNETITAAVGKVAAAYNVRPIAGTVMHEVKRFVIDGKKNILLRAEGDERVEACTVEAGDIFSIDVAMSSGDGKSRPSDLRTTVFKRQVDKKFGLKIKAARSFFNEVNRRFPALPFSTRQVGDETVVKMGVRECVAHELFQSYPVLLEKPGDQVAHVKFTVLVLPGGNVRITGLDRPAGLDTGAVVLPEDITAVLTAEDAKAKKKAKKRAAAKKKRAGGGGGGAAAAADEDDGEDEA